MASRSGGTNASGGATRRQGATAPSNPGAGTRSQSSAGSSGPSSQTGTNQSGSSSAATGGGSSSPSPSRGDQERELRTAREQSNVRQSSTGQRGNIERGGGFSPPTYAHSGNSPFAMMRRMMEDMDRLFSDFGFTHPGLLASHLFGPDTWPSGQPSRALGGGSSAGANLAPARGAGQQGLQRGGGQPGLMQSPLRNLWAPQVEVFERGNNLVVRADLPGLTREDVDVEIDDDALVIRGERHNDVEDEQEGYFRSERSYGSFYRAIPLPDNINPSACDATFKDGVLEVTLPKPPQPASKAKKIDVK